MWACGVCDPMPKFGASIQNGFEREPQGPEVHANRVNFGETFTRSSKDPGAILSELRGIPNGTPRVATQPASPFRMGFTNAGHKHGSPYERVPPPCPGLLEGFRTFRLNPETDTPRKTLRFHAKSHSKSEDLPFCDQMPVGAHFKRHCAR